MRVGEAKNPRPPEIWESTHLDSEDPVPMHVALTNTESIASVPVELPMSLVDALEQDLNTIPSYSGQTASFALLI